MKKKYLAKVKKKKVSLRESTFSPEKVFPYQEAIQYIRAILDEGKFDLARLYLEQTCEQVKTIPEPRLFLMNVYLDSMLLDEAEEVLSSLLKDFSNDAQVLSHCARFYQFANNIEQAIELVLRSLKLSPNNHDALEFLGLLHQSAGKKDQALKAFDAAIAVNANACGAILGKSKLLKSDCEQGFVDSVHQLAEKGGKTPYEMSLLYYALAWIYEKQDVSLHFDYLSKANQLAKTIKAYDLASEQAAIDKIIKKYSRDSVDPLRAQSKEASKPVFIVALARSGTTLLEQMLGAHPELEAIGESTAIRNAMVNASRTGNTFPTAETLANVTGASDKLMQIATEFNNQWLVRHAKAERVIDKSIGNAVQLGMILLAFPEAKVINLQRHPLDIIYSCYQQNFAVGNSYSNDLVYLAENYKLHRQLMDHWLMLFPDQIITTRYENLIADTEDELRKILEFCELDWDPVCLDYYKQKSVIKTASDNQVRQPIYAGAINKWQRVEQQLQPAVETLGSLAAY